jgi:hypothetical protein
MRIVFYLCLFLLATPDIHAQNVGIGTSSPVEKLDVAGGVKIGNTTTTTPGTMRWNEIKKDFEGYNGTAWVSLTGGKSQWGSQQSFSYENEGIVMGNTNSRFGTSLAVDGDLLAIGLPKQIGPNSTAQVGAVLTYKREGGKWRFSNYVQPSGLNLRADFGDAVALHNRTLVIGAPNMNKDANAAQGKVYVYNLNDDGNKTLAAELTAADGYQQDHFGTSISIYGNRIIAGAPGNDIGLIKSQGAAYIFEKNGSGVWQQTARLLHLSPAANDHMGMSVAIHGNYAAAGAPFSGRDGDIYNTNKGKVFLYQYNGTAWVQTNTLLPPTDAVRFDYYGRSLQLANDTLLIGMPQSDGTNSCGNGKVFLYTRSNGTWSLQTTLAASEGQHGDGFGTSLHLNGDYLIVGAAYASIGGAVSQGKAYVFKKAGIGWTQQAILTASHGNEGDKLGMSVGIVPDCAITGAPDAAHFGNDNMGRVYFYNR